ncbi:hypothetical protein BDA96_02G230600 [Sorghum bicolor]|uniref:Uncharacterized protein n=1 Tax=Sorghum bicolor TaxID=4558 RepID=A0A921RQL9_SORBI|nr:hypothetical protein BDA96_02G230600 [Sorghum bicolor]
MASSSAEGGLALAVLGQGERAAAAVSGQGERAAAAFSGQGGREAAAVSGQAVRAASAVSGHDWREAAAVSGDGEAAVSRKRKQCDYENMLDYPCTERLRWRRLLAFLRENCYNQIYHAAKNKLGVFFDLEDVVERVRKGQFQEACDHLWTFAPIRYLNSKAEVLRCSSITSWPSADSPRATQRKASSASGSESCTSILLCSPSILASPPLLPMSSPFALNSLNWQVVRNKAAEMVKEMVSEIPELKEQTRYPRFQNELYDVMPIRCSFRPRRQVKKAGKKQAIDLAMFYLETKKRLAPSAQMDYHDSAELPRNKSGLVLIKLFENVLQAGQRMVLKQGHPPEYLSRGVAAHACKSIPGHTMIEKGHQSEHASNQVFPFGAAHAYKSVAKRMKIEQGHGLEHSSNKVFPFEAAHAYKSVAERMKIEQGHGLEHASNKGSEARPW